MKKLTFISVITLLMSLFMVGCNNDEPETYWLSYGTYYESDETSVGFFINLDNGKRLIPVESSSNNTNVKDKSKVLVEYVIISETDDTVNVKVTGIGDILTKDILQLTEENKDSIGSDGVKVYKGDVWLTERHLNIAYSYYGYVTQHYINLVKPIGEQLDADGNQILEFKHNDNGDLQHTIYKSIVAFDMWSLYEEGMDSVNFIFKSMDYDSVEFTYSGTFYYGADSPAKIETQPIQEYFERVY